MKISKLPLRIEPGLVALLCAWFYFDPAGTFLPFVCAAALHEAGHLAMLLWLRQPVHSLCLGLQGAVLRTGPLRYRDELLAAAKPGCMVQHCLPAYREQEITTKVFEEHANEIFEEAENRLHAQKAVMVTLMGSKED